MLHTHDTHEETSPVETEVENKFEALPCVADYATGRIEESFDWEEIIFKIKQENEISLRKDLYLVVFKSQRRFHAEPNRNYVSDEELVALDEGVLEEARESPGFLYYFSGERDKEGNNLSFCLWTDREAVEEASLGPAHNRAKQAARNAYVKIDFTTYNVTQGPDGRIVHELLSRKQY